MCGSTSGPACKLPPVTTTSFADINAAILRVDDANVLVAAQTDTALRIALDMCRPRNWQGTGASTALLDAAKAEALPLAWVPPADVIRRLDAATSAAERKSMLLGARDAILEACIAVVEECDHPGVAESRTLVGAAVRAVKDGHHAAGMSLAVAVGEKLAMWAIEPRVIGFSSQYDYEQWKSRWDRENKKHERLAQVAGRLGQAWEFPHLVLIAPLHAFFVGFNPGGVEPEHLSRNVVAHAPTNDHLNPLNALKSVMMVTGILRSQQEWAVDLGDHY
jgi:hypothetical protein